MKSTLIGKAVDEIRSSYGTTVPESGPIVLTTPALLIREYPYFRANELLSITRTLTEKPGDFKPLILLVSTGENLLILATSCKLDCGKIVKDNAHVWRGKGGGNAEGARVMFPSRDDLECFITFVRQAYSSAK